MANVKRTSAITPAQIIAARGRRTQVQAAELLGLSLRQYRNYEKGVTAMRDPDYQSLAATTHKGD